MRTKRVTMETESINVIKHHYVLCKCVQTLDWEVENKIWDKTAELRAVYSSVILHRRVYPPVSILNSVINNVSPNLTINLPTYFSIISLFGETSLVAITADITSAWPAASLPLTLLELINHFYKLKIYQRINKDVLVKFWKFNRRWRFRVSHDCSIGTTSGDLCPMWNFC